MAYSSVTKKEQDAEREWRDGAGNGVNIHRPTPRR
jgi:hypothetical protein